VSKPSRFYCENCGGQVRANAKVCPHCGRFFSDVRCPSCGFTGDSKLFVFGCPSCGYGGSSDGGSGRGRSDGVEVYDLDQIDRLGPAASRRRATGAPPWIYWLVMALLGVFFVIMAVIYVRL